MSLVNSSPITYLLIFNNAKPTSNLSLDNLTGQGRLDVCCRTITTAFFLSNNFRKNVTYIAYFKTIEHAIIISGAKVKGINPDERSTAGFIRAVMRNRNIPGVKLVETQLLSLLEKSKNVRVLHPSGEKIGLNNVKLIQNTPITFIIGDNKGILEPEFELLSNFTRLSLGEKQYLSSNVITILNYLIDHL